MSFTQPFPDIVTSMHTYSYTFQRAVARGRPQSRAWVIRRERGVISTRGIYGGDVAPPIEVRRDAFKAWVKRVLAQAKTARNLSVVDIAELAGIGDNTIYRWANGDWKRAPQPDQIVAFCDALDISPSVPFGILWPGKNEAVPAPAPLPTDENYQVLMRKLNDPAVGEFEKEFIRETLRQLADRPVTRVHKPARTRRGGVTN
jgi:transcriptional regulator with XRE-family HTH domain